MRVSQRWENLDFRVNYPFEDSEKRCLMGERPGGKGGREN